MSVRKSKVSLKFIALNHSNNLSKKFQKLILFDKLLFKLLDTPHHHHPVSLNLNILTDPYHGYLTLVLCYWLSSLKKRILKSNKSQLHTSALMEWYWSHILGPALPKRWTPNEEVGYLFYCVSHDDLGGSMLTNVKGKNMAGNTCREGDGDRRLWDAGRAFATWDIESDLVSKWL